MIITLYKLHQTIQDQYTSHPEAHPGPHPKYDLQIYSSLSFHKSDPNTHLNSSIASWFQLTFLTKLFCEPFMDIKVGDTHSRLLFG